jgi:UPF0716 protein FxsA
VARRVRVAQSRHAAMFEGFGGMPGAPPRAGAEEGPAPSQGGRGGDPRVVRGEVIEEDREA